MPEIDSVDVRKHGPRYPQESPVYQIDVIYDDTFTSFWFEQYDDDVTDSQSESVMKTTRSTSGDECMLMHASDDDVAPKMRVVAAKRVLAKINGEAVYDSDEDVIVAVDQQIESGDSRDEAASWDVVEEWLEELYEQYEISMDKEEVFNGAIHPENVSRSEALYVDDELAKKCNHEEPPHGWEWASGFMHDHDCYVRRKDEYVNNE